MTEGHVTGVLDTSTYIDLRDLSPDDLPQTAELTTITLAELHQGVAMARNPTTRNARAERLSAAIADFAPLPFDADAASRYGSLVALVVGQGRNPRPRRLDLMIAAIASSAGLPLYTRNPGDLTGLDELVTIVAV